MSDLSKEIEASQLFVDFAIARFTVHLMENEGHGLTEVSISTLRSLGVLIERMDEEFQIEFINWAEEHIEFWRNKRMN